MADAITGDKLHKLLSQCRSAVDDTFELEITPWSEHAVHLADSDEFKEISQRLDAQPLQPSDFWALHELHCLCLVVGRTDISIPLLDTYGDALADDSDLGDEDQGYAHVYLACHRARLNDYTQDSVRTALHAMEKASYKDESMWTDLASALYKQGKYLLEREVLVHANTHAERYEDEDDHPILHSIEHTLDLGRSYHAQGDMDAAKKHARQAFDALTSANVKREDWFEVSQKMVVLDPQLIEPIEQAIRATLPDDAPQALVRCVDVQIARMQARVNYLQGHLNAAIDKGFEGWFELEGDDGFASITTCLIHWLQEAKQHERLANFLFDCVLNDNDECTPLVFKTAAELLEQGCEQPELPLMYVESVEAVGIEHYLRKSLHPNETSDAGIQRHLKQARDWATTDEQRALADLVEGVYLTQKHTPEAYAQALPLLEQGIEARPDKVSERVAMSTWLCRIAEHGIKKAFTLPIVKPSHAEWAYQMASTLLDEDAWLVERSARFGKWPEKKVAPVVVRYYEYAMERFEQFFATGQGHFCDADTHVYSMTCNDLASDLRVDLEDNEAALAVHQRALAVSPFAEHYDGMMYCYHNMEQWEDYFNTMETLWQFSQTHGYSRFDVCDEIRLVAETCYNLDKYKEIAIWLPRLQSWWDEVDEDEKEDVRDEYLSTLTYCLGLMAFELPEDAMASLNPVMDDVLASDEPDTLAYAGLVFDYAKDYERAMEIYTKAMALVDKEDEDHLETLELLEDNWIPNLRKKQKRQNKPWWWFF